MATRKKARKSAETGKSKASNDIRSKVSAKISRMPSRKIDVSKKSVSKKMRVSVKKAARPAAARSHRKPKPSVKKTKSNMAGRKPSKMASKIASKISKMPSKKPVSAKKTVKTKTKKPVKTKTVRRPIKKHSVKTSKPKPKKSNKPVKNRKANLKYIKSKIPVKISKTTVKKRDDSKPAEFKATENQKEIEVKPKLSKNIPSSTAKPGIDMSSIKAAIQKKIKSGSSCSHVDQINEQRSHPSKIAGKIKGPGSKDRKHVMVGVPGFDALFEKGIPKGSAVIVAGGAGSGKTIMSLQMLAYHACKGDKCFYMSFEESEDRLVQHMEEFGWNARKMIKSGRLKIMRYSPFEITRSVDAMLAKEKGELLIDLDPVIIPEGFKPDFIVLDSLTAVASAFTSRDDSYRIYIEQLFRFFEKLGATSFLITETKQIPEIFSTTGVEEFLADGVIVLYNFKRGDVRENAIEILKMRGAKHQKKIVAMQITSRGVEIYPDQEVFGGVDG
jgi:KaiC/GvpD/RAD55 family RecA-like ATPase